MTVKLAFSISAAPISCPQQPLRARNIYDDDDDESLWTVVNRVCDRYIAAGPVTTGRNRARAFSSKTETLSVFELTAETPVLRASSSENTDVPGIRGCGAVSVI